MKPLLLSQVRIDAEQQLAHAEKVANSLSQAEEAQNQADNAIQATQEDIDSARKDLAQVKVYSSTIGCEN